MRDTEVLSKRRDEFYEWYIKYIDRYGAYFEQLDYFSLDNYKINDINLKLLKKISDDKNGDKPVSHLIYFLYLCFKKSSDLKYDVQTDDTKRLEKKIWYFRIPVGSLNLSLEVDSGSEEVTILLNPEINNKRLNTTRINDIIFVIDEKEDMLYKGVVKEAETKEWTVSIQKYRDIKNQYRRQNQDIYNIVTDEYDLIRTFHYHLYYDFPTPIFKTKELHADVEQLHPVLFLNYYPLRTASYRDQELELYRYINGLKYVENDSSDSNLRNKEYFKEVGGLEKYVDDLLEVLNNKYVSPVLFIGIPSSKVEKKNMIEHIIEEITERQENYINAQFIMEKTEDTITAHENNNEARDIEKHIQSWKLSISDLESYLDYPVVVLDDVITSGSSFNAAYKYLRDLGFKKENLHFFAYGKSLKNIYLREIEKSRELPRATEATKPISGIIFDLDQTIINTNNIHEFIGMRYTDRKQFYRRLRTKINRGEDFQFYPSMANILKDLITNHPSIPVIFLTNNIQFTATVYLDGNLEAIIKKPKTVSEKIPDLYVGDQRVASYVVKEQRYINIEKIHNLISYNDAELYAIDSENVPKIKPSPDLVYKAIDAMYLKEENPRIIGVGNTEIDIAAYKNATIESILVNWGNQYEILNQFNADYVFDKIETFEQFLKENI